MAVARVLAAAVPGGWLLLAAAGAAVAGVARCRRVAFAALLAACDCLRLPLPSVAPSLRAGLDEATLAFCRVWKKVLKRRKKDNRKASD